MNVAVCLTVPVGVDRQIYPWGVHSLADYLTNTCDNVDVDIWNVGEESQITALIQHYGAMLEELFDSLRTGGRSMVFGHPVRPENFAGLVAATGGPILDIAHEHGLYRSLFHARHVVRHRQAITDFSEIWESFFEAAIGGYAVRHANCRVWAISVYDYTIVNALHLARVIRRTDPEATIVLGGDYFDYPMARRTVEDLEFVDAVAVGYGEEIIRQMVVGLSRGQSVHELEISSLVTNATAPITPRVSSDDRPDGIHNIPMFYGNSSRPPINYVRTLPNGTMRVLTQRGCSWGNCTFCTQLDRKLYYSIQLESLIEQIHADFNGPVLVRHVSLDSDENDLKRVLPILECVAKHTVEGTSIVVEFWLMVRMFDHELSRTIARLHDNIRVKVLMNVESLSIHTLQAMKKGHSPLQAIEGLKAIQDAGGYVQSNYLLNFPSETSATVAQEVDLLRRVAHLLMPPKARLVYFPYAANARDTIAHNANSYKIEIRRMPGDIWVNAIFGLDAPFSIWSYRYDHQWKLDHTSLVTQMWHRTAEAKKVKQISEVGSRVLHPKRHRGLWWWFEHRLHHADVYIWRTVASLLGGVNENRPRRRREQIMSYLNAVAQSVAGNPQVQPSNWKERARAWVRNPNPKHHVEQSQLFLEDGYLVKDYHLPGEEDCWRLPLDERDQRLLRTLYWCEKHSSLAKIYADWPSGELDARLERHIKIGSVAQFKSWFLCVANDPSYWSTNED